MEKTETGLDENLAGALCYVLGLVTGIIFLVIEKNNKFVKFHALQSIGVHVVFLVLAAVLTATIILVVLLPILWLVALVFWIVLMYKAYQGDKWKFPLVGNFAEKHAK